MREHERRPLSIARSAKPVIPTAGPVIMFTAGGSRFAIDASEVAEIRDRDYRRQDLPGAVDVARHVGLGVGTVLRLVVLKPGDRSLGVTEVERMTTLPKVAPLPGMFRGAERNWYCGLLLLENEVVPLVRTEYWRKIAASRTVGSGR